MNAKGLISGREYTEEMIFSYEWYPRMKEEPLENDEGATVIPVRNQTTLKLPTIS